MKYFSCHELYFKDRITYFQAWNHNSLQLSFVAVESQGSTLSGFRVHYSFGKLEPSLFPSHGGSDKKNRLTGIGCLLCQYQYVSPDVQMKLRN